MLVRFREWLSETIFPGRCVACHRSLELFPGDEYACPTCRLILSNPGGSFYPGASAAGTVATPPHADHRGFAEIVAFPTPSRERDIVLSASSRAHPRAQLLGAKTLASNLRLARIRVRSLTPLSPGADPGVAEYLAADLDVPLVGDPEGLTPTLLFADTIDDRVRDRAARRMDHIRDSAILLGGLVRY